MPHISRLSAELRTLRTTIAKRVCGDLGTDELAVLGDPDANRAYRRLLEIVQKRRTQQRDSAIGSKGGSSFEPEISRPHAGPPDTTYSELITSHSGDETQLAPEPRRITRTTPDENVVIGPIVSRGTPIRKRATAIVIGTVLVAMLLYLIWSLAFL